MTHALNTVRSAKDFFFPQTENLVDFKIKGKEIEVIDPRTEHEDFVVFGVRACDARSFTILDKVFLAEPGGHLLQVPPRARHHRFPGLHPSGGDLLLLHLRHRPRRPRGRRAAAGSRATACTSRR